MKPHYYYTICFISIFPFSLVYIALGAILCGPQLRILTALYDLFTARASIFPFAFLWTRLSRVT